MNIFRTLLYLLKIFIFQAITSLPLLGLEGKSPTVLMKSMLKGLLETPQKLPHPDQDSYPRESLSIVLLILIFLPKAQAKVNPKLLYQIQKARKILFPFKLHQTKLIPKLIDANMLLQCLDFIPSMCSLLAIPSRRVHLEYEFPQQVFQPKFGQMAEVFNRVVM